MKTDIILSGVGGQGILSIATIIGEAATRMGLTLKQAEVHGMSQRGGLGADGGVALFALSFTRRMDYHFVRSV